MNRMLQIVLIAIILSTSNSLSAQAITGEVINLPGYAFKYSAETSASKSTVWKLWIDVENWNAFDTALEYSYLEEGTTFGEGARGYLNAEGAPGVSFEIVDFSDKQSFTVQLNIPLYQVIQQRRYFELDNNGKTIFTHEVKFSGGLSPLVYLFLQRIYKKETQLVVEQLKCLAERQQLE